MTSGSAARNGFGLLITPSLGRAALNVGRAFLLLVTVFTLVVMRGESDIAVSLGLTAVAGFGVWLLFGRGASGSRALVVYVMGFALFAQLRSFGDSTGIPAHFGYVLDAETGLFGVLPSHWLQAHLYTPGHISPLDLYCACIYVSYFVALHVAALSIWRGRREWFATFAGAAMLVLFAGLAVSFVVPTAPPWLAGETGRTFELHRIMRDLLAHVSGSAYQDGASLAGVNDVAAMPSLHTGITVLLALAAWRFDRRLGLIGGAYAVSMGFTLVYFGEHYVMDVLAGAALAVACWALALRLWPLEVALPGAALQDTPIRQLTPAVQPAAALDDPAAAA